MINLHNLLVGILTSTIGIFTSFFTEDLFIKVTRNKRPHLTWLGIKFFGKNKDKHSEFINANKGSIIKIIDIIAGLSIGGVFNIIAYYLVEIAFAFYLPLFLIVINSIYFLIRKKFYKLGIFQYLGIFGVYVFSIVLIFIIGIYKDIILLGFI